MKTWKKAATLFLLLLLLFLLGARAVNAEEYNAVKVVIKDANTGNVCYSHVFPNGQDFSFSTSCHTSDGWDYTIDVSYSASTGRSTIQIKGTGPGGSTTEMTLIQKNLSYDDGHISIEMHHIHYDFKKTSAPIPPATYLLLVIILALWEIRKGIL